MDSPVLSQKEARRRELMLSGSQLKALLLVSLPLVFYACIGQFFQLIDTFIAANMSANTISTVSFVNQLEKMLMAVATALSIGGCVLIGKSFGSGDMEQVKSRISTIFFLCLFIGIGIFILILPLMYPLLKIMGMPKELLFQGTFYSDLVLASILFQFINTIFFAIEKSRGNTKIIMLGNLLVLFLKTSLNIVTIRLIAHNIIPSNYGIYCLPIATISAHLILTIIALTILLSKKNPFRIKLKACTFKKDFLLPLSSLSLPIFFEKFIFAFGKAFVNTLCASMGTTVVGALGVSDRICGLATNPITGFQEGETTLISNNLGNKNLKRAISFLYFTIALTMTYIITFFILTGIFRLTIIGLFARGNAAFAREIDMIYKWERLDTILNALFVSVMGFLYAFGKTKVSMTLNIARLFAFRIPILLLLIIRREMKKS
ncbi:MAG: MATE family efflux transporter [Treponema sp.]|nr:MATE family efflux transporter [Treponema sp.]